MSDFIPQDLPGPKKDYKILVLGALAIIVVSTAIFLIQQDSQSKRIKQLASPCFTAMQEAALEPDSTLAEPLIKRTAYACSGRAEWMDALEEFPEALGFTIAYPDSIETICYNYGTSPTCRNP